MTDSKPLEQEITNGVTDVAEAQDAQTEAQAQLENTFPVSIKLPHAPYKTTTIVSTQDQIQDVRQSIIDTPHTFQYSCFHLERDGERIPDFVDIAEIPSIAPDVELTLVEDPYTEKDARLHVLRVRELVGVAGDRSDPVQGIEAGLSLHDQVSKVAAQASASANGTQDASKPNPVHPMTGFDVDAAPNTSVMLPEASEPAPKTIKSLALSPWNPPPYHLRSKGHLLYLLITTNEGEQHQITSHVNGFFVNKSSNSKFDPFPRQSPKAHNAHSLLTLISRLSPSFDASFRDLQEYNGRKDLLAAFQLSNAVPASPWFVAPSAVALNEHVSDACRPQENYLVGGIDNAETLRDWNEEFQTTKELPRESVQDRVFRERVTSKLFADYTQAATQGAILIARGEVAPLNPTEPRDAQIFVYNNVFYSFGADGVGTFVHEGGDEAARVATGRDVIGVKTANQIDVPGLATAGTVIVDYLGKRIVCQSIVPGIFKQREPGEHQIDYGGVEGKEVVASNEAFAPLFKRLSEALRVKSHPVWDKEGKRHDLEASVETKGLLGTDGRKYILDLYRITPIDINWVEAYWKEPVDGKKDETTYPHRMTVLRSELVEAFWRSKLREYVRVQLAKNPPKESSEKTDDATEGSTESDAVAKVNGEESKASEETSKTNENDRVDLSGFQFTLNPDAFCGQKPQSAEEQEQLSKDEVDVRAASDFLQKEIMPRLVTDLQEGEVGFPMDGVSLSVLLHKRGVNVRYLGKLCELASGAEPRMQALRHLAEHEMISRAFKHIANTYLRATPFPLASSCIAHLLNCLLGVEQNSSPKAPCDEQIRSLYQEERLSYESVSPTSLEEQISAQVKLRYRYDLPKEWTSNIKKLQMLREICIKLGIQVAAKDYFATPKPATNGHTSHVNGHLKPEAPAPPSNAGSGKKNKKRNADASPNRQDMSSPEILPNQMFQADDILNLTPVIKDAAPRSALAEEALEAGRISVAQQQKELGQELLLESLSLHEQIYGIIHAEVARVYYNLSTLFYTLDDKAVATELARKAVIVSERTLGIDHNETVLAYLNLGLFEHAAGNTRAALAYMRHALELWKVAYGPAHPDSITTLNNAAVMLQNLKLYHDSRVWFEQSLAVSRAISGPASSNTATLLFQLAQALALDQDSKAAVNCMREAYTIFNATLGPDDRNTKEAETWLEQLTQNAVSIAKHAKDVQARRLRRIGGLGGATGSATSVAGLQAPRATPRPGQSEQDEAAGGKKPAGGVDTRSVEELLRYIEGSDRKTTPAKKRAANPKRR